MKDVFIKKNATPQDAYNVGVILSRSPTKGKVGLEIEVEGKNLLYDDDVPKGWGYHQDGSLRGEESAEYVLVKPVEFDDVAKSLDTLWESFAKKKSVLDDSNRTSVHVHLNCQDFHLDRLTSLMALYFIFEDVLTEWCGEHRVGNLFCLRAKDAPAIVSQVRRFIQADGAYPIGDHLHYSGLNANALVKFGSLEWRTLRGCQDKDTILNWVNILRRLYDMSAEFKDPRDICSLFSQEGPLSFFNTILREQGQVVRSGVPYDLDRICESMYEGIRMAQDLCYCRDWSLYRPASLQADPFGRDAKRVAKKLSQMAAPSSVGFDAEIEVEWDALPTMTSNYGPPPQPTFQSYQSLNTTSFSTFLNTSDWVTSNT